MRDRAGDRRYILIAAPRDSLIHDIERPCDVVNTIPPASPRPPSNSISVHNGTTRRSPNGIKTKGGVSRLNGGKHQFALTLARRVEIGNRIVRLVRNLHHPLRALPCPLSLHLYPFLPLLYNSLALARPPFSLAPTQPLDRFPRQFRSLSPSLQKRAALPPMYYLN